MFYIEDVIFDTMWKNRVTTHVEVHDNKVKVTSFCDCVAENAFAKPPFDIFYVNQFIEGRCFEECNADKEFFLKDLGLSSYNPWAIVRKTHGFLWDDYKSIFNTK